MNKIDVLFKQKSLFKIVLITIVGGFFPNCESASKIIGFSCNLGMPPIVGKDGLVRGELYVDCDPYKVGFSTTDTSPLTISTYQQTSKVAYKSWSTIFHVNGYWAPKTAQIVMTRFVDPTSFYQPFATESNPDNPRKKYKITPVDCILMAQNIVMDRWVTEVKKRTVYSSTDVLEYSKTFSSYFPNAGSLIEYGVTGMPATLKGSSVASLIEYGITGTPGVFRGSTQLANYIFDVATLASGYTWYGNDSDPSKCQDIKDFNFHGGQTGAAAVAKLIPKTDEIFTYAAKGTKQIVTYDFLQTAFVTLFKQELPEIKVSDYFNNDDKTDLYIPLHIVDPATTNVGFDEEVKK